jgi:hypothetical protein
MGLAAYLPLQQVYAFHEVAETWILRRYAPATAVASGAERTTTTYVASLIAVFRDRTSQRTGNADQGQTAPATCTVYTRTRLLTTQDAQGQPQPADVLTDPATGWQWQATAMGAWDEARGFVVTCTRVGVVGSPPWA